MLRDAGVAYTYREYREDPLSVDELRDILRKLGLSPRDLLRAEEANAAGLASDLSDDELIARMAESPTLIQRPIAVLGDRAIVARPAEELRSFLGLDPPRVD